MLFWSDISVAPFHFPVSPFQSPIPTPPMNKGNIFSRIISSLFQSFFCFVLPVFASSTGLADAVTVDNSFHPPGFAKATPPERALLLPDGKYFLFFDPDTLTDQTTGPLTRFLSDGTLDTSFSFSRDYKTVTAVTPVGNGQLYVAATRYGYGRKDAEQILRVNSDGSIDPSFAPATVGGTDSFPDVMQIVVQQNGYVLVAGLFQSFGGDSSRIGIVRLSANGTLDTSFAPVTINGDVSTAALQNDGKILIGG